MLVVEARLWRVQNASRPRNFDVRVDRPRREKESEQVNIV